MSEPEKNSPRALKRALNEGFGIETDVRDLNGKLVISHDPPMDSPHLLSLQWLLKEIKSSSSNGRIALNIKADGLSNSIGTQIMHHGIDSGRLFVFDMSVPDSIAYLESGIPVYSRISDYEQAPAFLEQAAGIWVDDFSGSFPQIERASSLIEQGARVTIVSPELHRRDHRSLWDKILETGIHESPNFELCTDFPIEAASRFCKA